jgi:cobalt-zinc-cadmium resistance protein CzcA
MLERIANWALDNILAVFCITIIAGVGGYLCFQNLTIEEFPDPSDPQVEVVTQYPGQSTEEVERQIGLPLERVLNGTPGMLRMRNLSLFGLSDIVMTFADGTDLQARASSCCSACATHNCRMASCRRSRQTPPRLARSIVTRLVGPAAMS